MGAVLCAGHRFSSVFNSSSQTQEETGLSSPIHVKEKHLKNLRSQRGEEVRAKTESRLPSSGAHPAYQMLHLLWDPETPLFFLCLLTPQLLWRTMHGPWGLMSPILQELAILDSQLTDTMVRKRNQT
jgi:hypothetical protein